MTSSDSTTCIVPRCSRVAKTRGLCKQCYGAANRKVKAGEITWDKLIELGLAKGSSRETGARDEFEAALAQAMKKKADQANPSQGPEDRSPSPAHRQPEENFIPPLDGKPPLPWQQPTQ